MRSLGKLTNMEPRNYDEVSIVKMFQEMTDRRFNATIKNIMTLTDEVLKSRLLKLSGITYAI